MIFAIIFSSLLLHVNAKIESIENKDYWFTLGKNDINEALKHSVNTNQARNVILFIGDGLGLSTTTASRIYDRSERGYLAFEKFPNIALLKTYSADKFVPDSSSTATAMFSGVKANQKTSGVDASVKLDDCKASLNPKVQLESIVTWAQAVGMKTGFVTTTRVTHATPSAIYAHTPNRKWECEATIPENSKMCKDIARQLIEDLPGRNINVIMGGGRQCLESNAMGNPSDPIDTWSCISKDGRNLTKDWMNDKQKRNVVHKYITNNEQLSNLTYKEDYVLGIFANGHFKMDFARDKGPKGMPSLQNMTKAAIKLLEHNNTKGYLLIVEGGMIDFAHHRGHARQALAETVAFSNAIEESVILTKRYASETLIIATSDHSQPMVIAGYANRSAPITGIAQPSKIDNVPYTTLLYGIGAANNYNYTAENGKVVRMDPTRFNTSDFYYAQQAGVLTDESTHEGTDVVVYAQGPMAHLFQSVHEQTYVAHVIAYAAKLGPHKTSRNSSNSIQSHFIVVLCIAIFSILFSY